MKKNIIRLFVLVLLSQTPFQMVAALGWGDQVPQQFKLNFLGSGQANENLRLAYNRDLSGASGGLGSINTEARLQDLNNQNNVIEITENNEIILNGNDNTVNTKGVLLNGEQDSETTNQDGTNTQRVKTAETNSDNTLNGDGNQAVSIDGL